MTQGIRLSLRGILEWVIRRLFGLHSRLGLNLGSSTTTKHPVSELTTTPASVGISPITSTTTYSLTMPTTGSGVTMRCLELTCLRAWEYDQESCAGHQ